MVHRRSSSLHIPLMATFDEFTPLDLIDTSYIPFPPASSLNTWGTSDDGPAGPARESDSPCWAMVLDDQSNKEEQQVYRGLSTNARDSLAGPSTARRAQGQWHDGSCLAERSFAAFRSAHKRFVASGKRFKRDQMGLCLERGFGRESRVR